MSIAWIFRSTSVFKLQILRLNHSFLPSEIKQIGIGHWERDPFAVGYSWPAWFSGSNRGVLEPGCIHEVVTKLTREIASGKFQKFSRGAGMFRAAKVADSRPTAKQTKVV